MWLLLVKIKTPYLKRECIRAWVFTLNLEPAITRSLMVWPNSLTISPWQNRFIRFEVLRLIAKQAIVLFAASAASLSQAWYNWQMSSFSFLNSIKIEVAYRLSKVAIYGVWKWIQALTAVSRWKTSHSIKTHSNQSILETLKNAFCLLNWISSLLALNSYHIFMLTN